MSDRAATTTPSAEGLWREAIRSEAFSHEWSVFFMDSERTGWWKLFTRPGFEHCFAITYAPEQKCWFLMDWNIYFMVAQPLADDMVGMLFVMARLQGYKIVKYKPRHVERVRYRIGWNYCVPAIKHLLGINSWAVTPYQLYRHLLRNGGKESFAGDADAPYQTHS